MKPVRFIFTFVILFISMGCEEDPIKSPPPDNENSGITIWISNLSNNILSIYLSNELEISGYQIKFESDLET